jgi:plasmid stabilization system protein ParE
VKVGWSSDAGDDRVDIRDYIATDNPRAALRADLALGAAAEQLGGFPLSGHAGLLPDTREILAYNHFRLGYQVRNDVVWILALVHTSRQWPPAEAAP